MMFRKLKTKLSNDIHLTDLVKGSAITFVLKILGMILSYGVIILISKKNGATGVGYYSLVNQLLLLLGVLSTFGTTTSVLRFIGQFTQANEPGKIRQLYATVVSLVLPASIIIGAVVFLLAETIATIVFNSPSYYEAIQFSGLILPIFALNNVQIEFIRGLKLLAYSESIRSILRPTTLILILAYFWNASIKNIEIIHFLMASILIAGVSSSLLIVGKISRIKEKSKGTISRLQVLKVSSPMMLTSVTSTIMSAFAIFIMEYYYSTDKVGVFGVAVRISQLIAIILLVINTIAGPKFAELYWAKKTAELQNFVRQSSKILFWTSLLTCIVVVVFAKTILGFFGTEFTQGYWILVILTAGQLFNAATGSVGLLLNMSGHQNILTKTALIALIVQVASTLILRAFIGDLGIPLGTVFAAITWNLLCVVYVQRNLNIKSYYLPIFNN